MIGVWHGDDGVARSKAFGDRFCLGELAYDQRVVHPSAYFGNVIVKQRHHMPGFRLGEFADQARARCSCTKHQHRLALRGGEAVKPVLAPAPIGESRSAH